MKKFFILSISLGISWMATAQIQIDTLKVYFKNIENPIDFIKHESIGGKLDFYASLLKEKKKFYFYNMASYNKKNYSFLLWGRAVKIIGIKTFPEAIRLWEEINKREMTNKERTPMWLGFDNAVII